MRLDGVARQFRITIATKTLSKRACFRKKQIKSFFDVRLGQRLQRKDPVVACGAVNEHEDVTRAPNGNGVIKANVNLDLVQVLVGPMVN